MKFLGYCSDNTKSKMFDRFEEAMTWANAQMTSRCTLTYVHIFQEVGRFEREVQPIVYKKIAEPEKVISKELY